jgi:lipoprotein-releasing system ATP-binding protein
MPDPVLELCGVIKEFGDVVVTRVLHGIDLRMMPGEFAALIGPSGSGKSTLLNLIGLLDRPTSGEVRVQGERTDALEDDERSRPARAQPRLRVPVSPPDRSALRRRERHDGARRRPAAPDREMRRRSAAALAEVGLGDRVDEDPRRLSGGQQQRVAIARALVRRPPLVLADEPTGNLDTRTADEIFTLMRKVNAGAGHRVPDRHPRPADRGRCDRTIEIVDGRLVRPAA